jgi:ceramide glucosyltransferase
MTPLDWIEIALLAPVAIGAVYQGACVAAARVAARRRGRLSRGAVHPPVTLFKPVYGTEPGLEARLRSALEQDYLEFQVILCVQNPADPAVPILRALAAEYGPARATLVIEDRQAGPNGKVNNLLGALPQARHDVFVISDSDVMLPPDYLRIVVAPLEDPGVGCVSSLFRVAGARSFVERLELLNINADFMPSVVFATTFGVAKACLGPSIAIRRADLERIGGLESMAEYLTEDYEIGRRIWEGGRRMAVLPHVVAVQPNLSGWRDFWRHTVYWDKNTFAAQGAGFVASVLAKSVPFAFLFAALRLGDAIGLAVLAATLAWRTATAALAMRDGLGDREGLRALHWLWLRDLLGMASWVLALGHRELYWRGRRYRMVRGGRMIAIDA